MAEDATRCLDALYEDARGHVRGLKTDRNFPAVLSNHDYDQIQSPDLPTVVEQLLETGRGDSNREHEAIVVGEAYLRNNQVDLMVAENHAAATRLLEWTIEKILPTEAFAVEPPFATVSPEEAVWIVSMEEAGLHLLSHLQRLQLSVSEDQAAALIACLASFTNPQDPWTSQGSHLVSKSMLASFRTNLDEKIPKQFDTLIRNLLLNHVKPLFQKSKNPNLTPQARKAISPLPPGPADFESPANKPWKFSSPHILTVFEWILSQLTPSLVETHWPLLIPPLLTLIDDISTPTKIKGCTLLLALLQTCPSLLLQRSGLGEIFHNTLLPYLLYLPSLTPEEESLPLLNATYTALIALTQARFPDATPTTTTTSKIKALDAIFRYGILKGYAHAGENVRVASLLMRKSRDLVDVMGTYCVKHLKDLLPMISGILTAPFATAYPPLVETAVETLRAVVVNGWPRVGYHRGEILEGLVVCWCRIDEEEEERRGELTGVKSGIEEVVRAVVQILRDDEVARAEIQMLRRFDPRFEALLDV
ncbi:MAG: hypothetical protein LQ338_005340 [Usnochroma carphineum]|nr:MAG: hypothetical protein LQ338_005340 [Usnochroma carphineum]